ncbi:MAG: DUF2712 domain-containing protein [Agathobacter sp.]|nr:DUF2712 domain-containing protein [Agathobacter sp.]
MKTMKKILAVLTFVICVMFCCISLGKQGVLAAGNYKDTSYSFSFQNRALYTQARSKNDYTSSYMKCTSCTSNTSYTAHVVATTSIFSNDYVDASRGHVYCFTTGTTYKMLNWVKEDGFSYAAIQGNPNYGYNFSASGYWSPDSI